MTTHNIAKIIHIFHKIFVYIVIFGCFLPYKYLVYHQFLWPIIYIHWKTNKNKCMITQLESYLKNTEAPTVNKHDGNDAKFITKFFRDWGIHLKPRDLHKLTMLIFVVSLIITLVRLYIIKK